VLLFTIALLLAACLIATRLAQSVRAVALRRGFVDRPDGHRKLHRDAVPLGGGIVVFISAAIVVAALFAIPNPYSAGLATRGQDALGLFLGGLVIVLVGLADDVIGLRGRQKLLGQTLAAAVLLACGLSIDRIQIFDWQLDLGRWSIPLTLFWFLGAINSVNLLDGIDGLATTLGIVLSTAIGLMAATTGHPELAVIALVFAASLCGFLRFNFPPARMYLGDAGSMLIGLIVGALAIQASLKGPGTVLLAAPVVIWTVPIFDSAAAILRRKLTGRSVYTSDRAHLHHALTERVGNCRALVWLAVASSATSLGALASVWWKNDAVAILSAAAVVLVFILTRVFGYSELKLVTARLSGFLRSLVTIRRLDSAAAVEQTVRLQGSRPWEILWESLTEWGDKLDLRQIRLDVNVPLLGEGYHASWQRAGNGEADRAWRLELPLLAGERVVGSLKIAGDCSGTASENLQRILDLLEPFEAHLLALAEPVYAADEVLAETCEFDGLPDDTISNMPVTSDYTPATVTRS
jgi:UDP-GlcNAc:undecaprenyl-phosphate GlcNAc-1-phosphate transferase